MNKPLSILILLLTYTICQETATAANTIQVSGEAIAYLSSNLFSIGFTVETTNMTATVSLYENRRIANLVDSVFSELNIPLANITTTDFTIEPKRESVKKLGVWKEIFKGYTVSNQIEVKLGDINLLTKLLDRITRAGVNIVKYITFEIDPQTEKLLRTSLITAAVSDAREKANILASSLGVSITGIHNVKFEIPQPILPVYERGDTMAEAPQEAKVYTGANNKQVRVSVDISFRIRNK
jgi:uncharacterized protein YggE